jgi:hypothetical protein
VTRLLIYSSPVDHHNPADWYRYRDRIHDILDRARVASSVTVDDDALFTYGADMGSVIARVNATRPHPGEVVLAQWSTIVFYSASVLFLGDRVEAPTVRGTLSDEPFLKEHVGAFSVESGSCYGYERFPYEDEDIAETRRIVECVPNRVYVGASWSINDGEGRPDERNFEILHRLPLKPGRIPEAIVAVRPRTDGAEEELWRNARHDGIAVLSQDDPRLQSTIAAAASETTEWLPLFMGSDADGRARPRVTIGYCHMDDVLVCLYNHPPVADESLRFLV